ncbi:MAG: hypothetical protein H8E66_25970 [Planctomycetes bacterium]|nr:hypothetical protein [Planctomycetota bacterium]
MNFVLRFSACLALLGSMACLIGCGSSAAKSPASAVEQHDHDESHDDGHGPAPSGSLADAVAKVERLASSIQEAFTAGDFEKGHGPLHEIGHLLEALPDAAAIAPLSSTQKQRLKEAVDSLMDGFGTLDERLHSGSNDGRSYADVAAQIEEAMAKLKAVRDEEQAP